VITNRLERVREVLGPGPVVVKTIANAAVDLETGPHHIYTQLLTVQDLDRDSVHAAPCIFQAPAKPGIDVRVTVVDESVLAAEIDAPDDQIDWRAAPSGAVSYRPVELPEQVAVNCRRLCRAAGLVFGALDLIRQPSGGWVFLEINPSGQWGWIEQATGLPITAAIVDTLLKRESQA
jgi:hypothetical protein